jgi:hypothetical protein
MVTRRKGKRGKETNGSAAGRASPFPAAAPTAPDGAHEWVSFEDPEEQRTWVFDVTFLLSPWRCIYGHGCQGVLTGPAPELEQGCCSYGAHFTGADDVDRVRAAARDLTAEQWQFYGTGRRGGIARTQRDGTRTTRIVEGACIFLNRPGFPGGAGCALHRAALEAGTAPHVTKPDVCWQLPLRREDADDPGGHVTSTVSQWERRHWGDGGADFHWWCTEAPEAFTAPGPVYRHMADELTELVGPQVYGTLCQYLEGREGTTFLPHPALRARRVAGV